LLEQLEGLAAEQARVIAELRAEIAEAQAPAGNGLDEAADDFAGANLIDTHAAEARFGYPRNTIARWAREGDGVRRGGRWLVSVPRVRRRVARLPV
jgi:hypothetical protein